MKTRDILLRCCASTLLFWVTLGVNAQSPPSLVASAPSDGQQNIPLNTTVSFTFNEPMQPGYSVNWGAEVPSRTNHWTADQRTLIYTFLDLLPPNTFITWEMNPTNFNPNFKNLAGIPLPPGQYHGSFTTGTNVIVSVSGHVYCTCDGSPITNALVQITNALAGRFAAATDGEGSYTISNVLSDIYAATVTANHFATLSNALTVPSANFVATNDFYLTNLTLVINPIFDDTIVTNSNAATITNSIKAAIDVYNQTIANPICLPIRFVATNDLAHPGSSTVANTTISYSLYHADLQANTNKSVSDLTALATLGTTSGTGTNGNSQIMFLTAANLLAIGESEKAAAAVSLPAYSGYYGIIKLDVSEQYLNIKLARLQSVVAHEINEVLGIGGYGSSVGLQDDTIGPLDLFRYSSNGMRSFTTNANATAYFSIDGGVTTNVFFSQTPLYDYGDWGNGVAPFNNPPQVQDAYGNNNPEMGKNEFIALDVVGYTLLVTPFTIQTFPFTSGLLAFSWPSLPGQSYQMQFTTNLTGNVWYDVADPLVARDMMVRVQIIDAPGFAPIGFFRVVALPPSAGP